MDNLRKAKVQIILKSPFFASLMLRRQFIEDKSIKTTVTNGKVIKYNPAYFEGLKLDEIQGVIVQELLHITNLHHTRRENRDLKIWNEACDYAINPMITESGYVLPKGALKNTRFKDMPAEAIFRTLQQEKQEQEGNSQQPEDNAGNEPGSGQQDDPNGMGGVEDTPAQDESQIAQAEAEAKVELAQALQIAKQAGKIPAGLQRLVEEILQPKQNWKETLARFVTEQCKNDYSWAKPNTRYLHSGFILPSLHSLEIGEIILAADTSGSVDEKQLNEVGSEVQDIANTFNVPLKVVYCDAEIQGVQDIEPDEPVKLEVKGGGGTDFIPPFKWVEHEGITPSCLIYFTDGCCSSFAPEPEYPVLWAVWGGRKFNPPYGEVIEID